MDIHNRGFFCLLHRMKPPGEQGLEDTCSRHHLLTQPHPRGCCLERLQVELLLVWANKSPPRPCRRQPCPLQASDQLEGPRLQPPAWATGLRKYLPSPHPQCLSPPHNHSGTRTPVSANQSVSLMIGLPHPQTQWPPF